MSSKSPTETLAQSLQLASAITTACANAGIADAAEIPALIAYSRSAEQFNTALEAYQRAEYNYNRFIAVHGADDPGQDEYIRVLTGAREVYAVARRSHSIALHNWRVARGLDQPTAIAA